MLLPQTSGEAFLQPNAAISALSEATASINNHKLSFQKCLNCLSNINVHSAGRRLF
jgi:hypothetical protein